MPTTATTSEQDFENFLQFVLNESEEATDEGVMASRVRTFSDSGVLTMNNGLVVSMDDGSEFQVTIARRK